MNKYIAIHGLTNNSSIGIKAIDYDIDTIVSWDTLTDKIIESGESKIEYINDEPIFRVGEFEIPLNECIRIK